jgi:CheY-like chemotaxis protein
MKIFVIDDDLAFIEHARSKLSRLGANVSVHLGSRGALYAARRHGPDLVLLDMNMPGLSGSWLLAELRKQCLHARIIFCSDTHPGSLKRLAKAVGADGAISKTELNELGADELQALMRKEPR